MTLAEQLNANLVRLHLMERIVHGFYPVMHLNGTPVATTVEVYNDGISVAGIVDERVDQSLEVIDLRWDGEVLYSREYPDTDFIFPGDVVDLIFDLSRVKEDF